MIVWPPSCTTTARKSSSFPARARQWQAFGGKRCLFVRGCRVAISKNLHGPASGKLTRNTRKNVQLPTSGNTQFDWNSRVVRLEVKTSDEMLSVGHPRSVDVERLRLASAQPLARIHVPQFDRAVWILLLFMQQQQQQ